MAEQGKEIVGKNGGNLQKWDSEGGLKALEERFQQRLKLFEIAPEELKYYGIQFVAKDDRGKDKVESIPCFNHADADRRVAELKKRGIPCRLVEGLKSKVADIYAATVGIQERLDMSQGRDNFDQASADLTAGKKTILWVWRKTIVEFRGLCCKGESGGCVELDPQKLWGLDKIFHGLIARTETRALARAICRALGIPLQLAEDIEAAEVKEPPPKTVVTVGVPEKPKKEKPEVTPVEERVRVTGETLDKIGNGVAPANKIKKELGIDCKVGEMTEAQWKRFIGALREILAERSKV